MCCKRQLLEFSWEGIVCKSKPEHLCNVSQSIKAGCSLLLTVRKTTNFPTHSVGKVCMNAFLAVTTLKKSRYYKVQQSFLQGQLLMPPSLCSTTFHFGPELAVQWLRLYDFMPMKIGINSQTVKRFPTLQPNKSSCV